MANKQKSICGRLFLFARRFQFECLTVFCIHINPRRKHKKYKYKQITAQDFWCPNASTFTIYSKPFTLFIEYKHRKCAKTRKNLLRFFIRIIKSYYIRSCMFIEIHFVCIVYVYFIGISKYMYFIVM